MKKYTYRAYKTVGFLEHTTIIVRAEDEDEARVLAMECVGIGEDADAAELDWEAEEEESSVNETLGSLVSVHDSPSNVRALL